MPSAQPIADRDLAASPEATTTSATSGSATGELSLPEGVRPIRLFWPYVVILTLIHALSLLALVSWFFSWTGVALAVAGHYVFGMLGMTLCYHRLLAHRGFTCPKWFEYSLAILGVCCLQDAPARWVAIHRKHHQHSDHQADPHSPLVNFLWSHFGWLLLENRQLSRMEFYDRYGRDLLRERFYRRLERGLAPLYIYIAHALLFYLAGLAAMWFATGDFSRGVQFGLSLLIWGVFVRTVVVWHITWSVNSVAHVWGYRSYASDDNSRNNWLVGLLAHGEGWHNNHHAQQRAAAHGHRWWEFDLTYLTIRGLQAIGLIRDVVKPQVR